MTSKISSLHQYDAIFPLNPYLWCWNRLVLHLQHSLFIHMQFPQVIGCVLFWENLKKDLWFRIIGILRHQKTEDPKNDHLLRQSTRAFVLSLTNTSAVYKNNTSHHSTMRIYSANKSTKGPFSWKYATGKEIALRSFKEVIKKTKTKNTRAKLLIDDY